VIQRLNNTIVEIDTTLCAPKSSLESIDLPLANRLRGLQEVPRNTLCARRCGKGAIPVVVTLGEFVRQFLVQVKVGAIVGCSAFSCGERCPKIVEECVAMRIQLVEEADDSKTVISAMECIVVELVYKMCLEGVRLPIDSVLRVYAS
jgi:hypothetical protein